MGFSIDTATMFVALFVSAIAAMLVLLWGFLLNRGERGLLWMALGFLFGSAASLLIAGRGTMPDWLAVHVGGTTLLLGLGFLWISARAFNGRPVSFSGLLISPVLWLALCALPSFNANLDMRVTAISVATAVYYFAAGREFARRDGLLTRLPLSLILFAHGAAVLLRVPSVWMDERAGLAFTGDGWFGMAALESLIFFQLLAFLMVSLAKERVECRLHEAAHADPLTGIGNRRAFFEQGELALAQALRTGSALAVIVFDLDRFKDINDRYGHPVGDAVLQAFARAAGKRLRPGDIVARLGGEEFAILLPDTDAGRAGLLALQVNQAFEAEVAGLSHPGLAGSASAGVALSSPESSSLDALLTAADRALYEAKALGRHQVRLYEGSEAAEIRAA